MTLASANDLHMAGIADHNELPAAFDHVKTAAAYFGGKGRAPEFVFDITHCTAHNAAFADRFCLKHGIEPGILRDRVQNKRAWHHLHARKLT